MSHQKRREPLPTWYRFGDAVFKSRTYSSVLFERNLRDNFRDGARFVVEGNPAKTLANLIDDAAMRAAYDHVTANVIKGEHHDVLRYDDNGL